MSVMLSPKSLALSLSPKRKASSLTPVSLETNSKVNTNTHINTQNVTSNTMSSEKSPTEVNYTFSVDKIHNISPPPTTYLNNGTNTNTNTSNISNNYYFNQLSR